MHVGRSATVTGHRIICNMHSSAVSPADTSYMEQMNVLSQQHLEQADRAVLLHQRVWDFPKRVPILNGPLRHSVADQTCRGAFLGSGGIVAI